MNQGDVIVQGGGCLLVVLLLGIATCSIKMEPPSDAERREQAAAAAPFKKDPEAAREKINDALARKGEAMVRTMLKDPDSAQFSETMGRVKRGEWVACGHVNSRDSFGAMAGNVDWVALPTRERAYIESENDDRGFTRNWNRYCTGYSDKVDTDITPMHVAVRELKANKYICKISDAQDMADGSVTATCTSGARYRMNYIQETDHYVTYRCDSKDQLPVNRC